MSSGTVTAPMRRTPLYDEHLRLGAKMVPFAGYEMPVNYALGVLKEHLWTREKAGLFDVAHMGVCELTGPDHATTAAALEALVAADIAGLKPGQQRYSQFLDDKAGIIDDLMITRPTGARGEGGLLLVVNAGRKDVDYAHMRRHLPPNVRLTVHDDQALIALQGPAAANVLAPLVPEAGTLTFMTGTSGKLLDVPVHLTRSGYTGEDGYEIAVPAASVSAIWRKLLENPAVQAIGLGARDSLRLEAGLCLHGHDIDETTTPIEAGLLWSIQKRRRTEGGFPGATIVQEQIAKGPARIRVGIRPEGRAPAREGTEILDAAGKPIGKVTSGGFGPSVNAPIAMGYVAATSAAVGATVSLMVRGKPLPAAVSAMPFAPHRYARKA